MIKTKRLERWGRWVRWEATLRLDDHSWLCAYGITRRAALRSLRRMKATP